MVVHQRQVSVATRAVNTHQHSLTLAPYSRSHDTASSGRGWQLHYDLTLSGSYTATLDNATSTYVVSVLRPSGDVTATNLWFFDSGDVECEGRNVNNNGCVSASQLAWLRAHPQPRAFGLAWVHIPVPEVMAVWSNTNSTGDHAPPLHH